MFPGKTLLTQASIARDAATIVSDPGGGLVCQIICVWQDGAYALIEQYKELVSNQPKASHLEVMVVTKKELMRKFRVKEEAIDLSTTYEINSICANISQLEPSKLVYLYIDECWVTIPRKFSPHLTDVSMFLSFLMLTLCTLGQPK